MFDNSFIDACLYGDAELEDLDKYVEYWHTHDTQNTLCEFLGMVQYEYEEWLKNDDSIFRDILRCRVDNILFKNYKNMSNDEKIAARSYSVEDIEKLRDDNTHGEK